jgi:hypothetical protein
MKVYQGWAGIFEAPEKADWTLGSSVKKPSPKLFKEAPDGWLKNTEYQNIHVNFVELKNYDVASRKKDFIMLAHFRSGFPQESIRILTEEIALDDGRKGEILFYVCRDSLDKSAGNFFDCELNFPSGSENKNITSYKIYMLGVPDLPEKDYGPWKDYFKKILITIKPLKK